MVRRVQPSDKPQIRALWKQLFHDSESFMDFFFEKRFYPDYSVCVFEDGMVRSCLQSMPLRVLVRGTSIPCAIVAGVSTDPAYRKRGYMTQAFSYYMNMISDLGAVLAPHTPASLPTFFSLGHLPVSDTMHFSVEHPAPRPMPPGIEPFGLPCESEELYGVYRRFSRAYSGIIDRSSDDHFFKLTDYASDRAAGVLFRRGGRVQGYCAYYDLNEGGLYGVEFAAENPDAGQALIEALVCLSDGRPLKIKMPPDSAVEIPGAVRDTRPHGVMGVADAPALLSMLGRGLDFSVAVEDHVVSKNNGVFSLKGQPSKRAPDIRLSSGRLAQWLVGYRSLSELRAEAAAEILNEAAARELDRLFPKQCCYIIDEY